MAGQGPRLGQPADTRLVLTSDTGFAIQLYSMPKYEIWALPISLMGTQGSGNYLRSRQDTQLLRANHFFVIHLFLFSVLELKKLEAF